jgi:hypothetical protein
MNFRRILRGRGVETPLSLEDGVPTPLSGLTTRANRRLGHLLIRDRADDRYIYSYPRSGSTWLRTILANIIDPDTGANPDRRFALIPGVSARNARRIARLDSPRLLKSHGRYMGAVPRAVYLVRDGRDVIVSMYHKRITRPGHADKVDFPDFCRRYFRGDLGERWDDSVMSWLERGRADMGEALKVVRFEDLKRDLAGHVKDIAGFLGIDADDSQISAALDKASLERLRESERSRVGDLAPDRSVYRGGKVGQWRDMLTGELYDRFMSLSSAALAAAGYQV